MTDTEQAETRDIDVIHEFTDLETFTKAVEGAVLLKLDFDIATEIRDAKWYDMNGIFIKEVVIPARYWLITVHGGING